MNGILRKCKLETSPESSLSVYTRVPCRRAAKNQQNPATRAAAPKGDTEVTNIATRARRVWPYGSSCLVNWRNIAISLGPAVFETAPSPPPRGETCCRLHHRPPKRNYTKRVKRNINAHRMSQLLTSRHCTHCPAFGRTNGASLREGMLATTIQVNLDSRRGTKCRSQ